MNENVDVQKTRVTMKPKYPEKYTEKITTILELRI